MLKLIKYELLHSYRTFVLTFACFLGFSTVVAYLTKDIDYYGNGFVFVSYIILMAVIFVALFVSIIHQFYKSMYSRSGYLTLTLPVNTYEIIIAKIISSIIWFFVGLCVLIVGYSIYYGIQNCQNLGEYVNTIKDMIALINSENDYHLFKKLLEFVMSLVLYINNVYFIVTLVHTKFFRRNRLIWGIGLFLVLSIGINFFYDLLNIHDGMLSASTMLINVALGVGGYSGSSLAFVITNIFQIIVFFVLTIYLIDHQIELD